MLSLRPLTLPSPEAAALRPLIDPLYYPILIGKDAFHISNTKQFALAVYSNESPIAVALATGYTYTHEGEILQIVGENRKALKLLINGMRDLFKQEGYHTLTYTFEESVALTEVLNECGWSAPTLSRIRCTYDALAFHPPWFDLKIGYPPDVEEFLWKDLPQDEKNSLKNRVDRGLIPYSVSPFKDEEKLEPLNSLGIRYQGEIVGWMITTRLDPETIEYSSLYIVPRFRKGSISIQMLMHAIQLQKEARIPWAVSEVNVEQVSSNWVAFVKRRLAPFSESVVRVVSSMV